MRGPRPERGAVAATPVLDCDAAERTSNSRTTRTEPLTLLSKAPDRSGWRGARTKEPTVRRQQAGACTIVAVTGRMPIIHPRIRERCSCCSSISRSRRLPLAQ